MFNIAFLAAEFPTVHEAAVAAERHVAGDSTAAFLAGKAVGVAAIFIPCLQLSIALAPFHP